MPQSKAARITGISWLIIIVAGIVAEFVIRMPLIVPGDAAATAGNITDSEWLFRISIVSDLIMLFFDVVVALALYVLLKPINRSLALLAAFFRLVMNAILGINLVNLTSAIVFSGGSPYLEVFEPDQLQALALHFLKAHSSGYDIGLVFFGVHLFIVGYLVFKSDSLPRILGILLLFASFGYIIDSLANVLLSDEHPVVSIAASILIFLALVAELSLSIWLIVKGSKIANGPTER
jgi:hypothetical protein